MIKAKCDQFGNCPLADGKIHDVESIGDHPCDIRRDGGECGLKEVSRKSIGMPDWVRPAAIVGAGVLLLGGGGYGAWKMFLSPPKCEAGEVQSLLALAPKLAELEDVGTGCFSAAIQSGDIVQMALAAQTLRLADSKGSAKASATLGRLFDPLKRAELEAEAAMPQVLPAPDPRAAVRFYDRAAKLGDEGARAAAAALRQRYDLPDSAGVQTGKDGAPLAVPGHPDIFQRVIAKPDARLSSSPQGGDGSPVKPFELFYVFGTKGESLQVGRQLGRGPEGWIAADKAQDWNVMLVMRYAPPGQRRPVTFYRDELSLKSLISQPAAAESVDSIIASADGGEPDPRLVAVEDKSVDWASQPYVMPILQANVAVADDGRNVTLARIGSLAGGASVASSAKLPAMCAGNAQAANIHQVVFVIDTTTSMGPYIEGVKQIAAAWQKEVESRNVADRFRFGVVAYRNNMSEPAQAGLEYVSRTILPLAAGSDARAFSQAVQQLRPATVSTHSFDEDAVAGLSDALALDWSGGCGVRLVFQVTDAGTLKSDDPKARHQGVGLTTIAARAREAGIRPFVVHVATREAQAARNLDAAEATYREAFANAAGEGYTRLNDGSAKAFGQYLSGIGPLISAVADEKTGKLQNRPAQPDTRAPGITNQVLTELFSVQQRFVGAAAGTQAATFTESWTSDRDLADLNREALEVSVFLTRQQLSQLAEQTERLVLTARQAKMESDRFFGLLSVVSAATAQDPTRFGGDVARLDAMLPSFLKLLPYRSDVLSLTAADWRAMGATKQDAFLRRLSEKLAFYRSIEQDQSKWRPLGSSEPANAVALVPLRQMP